MNIKPCKPKSVHQSFLGRLRMKSVTLHTDSGAEFFRFEFTASGWDSSRPYSALTKVAAYLEEQGYTFKEKKVKYLIGEKVHSYWHVFENGPSEVYVAESLPFENSLIKRSRVDRIQHYPNGKIGPYARTVTISEMINAMSWGMAS